jgi:hypothetical protein
VAQLGQRPAAGGGKRDLVARRGGPLGFGEGGAQCSQRPRSVLGQLPFEPAPERGRGRAGVGFGAGSALEQDVGLRLEKRNISK